MSEVLSDSKEVASKAIRGIVVLGGRQVFVHGLNTFGNILLARLLSPSDFGVYAVVVFLVSFLGAFGGTGLASNLIRAKTTPSEAEYKSVFAAQQSILLGLTLVLWTISPKLVALYGLGHSYVWLFRLASLSLMVTSFMVIPQIKLERELAFSKLAVAEVWQAIAFNACAILMSYKGWGGMAFAVALLARSLAGVTVIYFVQPWRPAWHWDWQLIKSNLAFGFFYQLSQLVSLVKDSITPLLIGLVLGATDVGYTSWASMLASYPVLALMILQRVYLPVFSRLQHDPEKLKQFFERIVLGTNVLAAPIAVFTLVLIYPISGLVYGTKWYVAVPLFLLFWTTNLFAPTATPALGLLNALGFSRIVFGFSLFWMSMSWMVGIPLVLRMGMIGLAWSNVLVQLSNLALFAVAKKKLPVKLLRQVVPGWLLAAIVGGLLWEAHRIYPIQSIHALVLYLGVAVAVYGAGIIYWHGSEVRSIVKLMRPAKAAL